MTSKYGLRIGGIGGPAIPFSRLPLALFCMACLTLPIQVFRLGDYTLSDLLFILTALVCFLTPREWPSKQTWISVSVMLCLVGGVLVSFEAVNQIHSLQVLVRLLYIWTIWQWSARASLLTHHHVNLAMVFFTVGAALSAAVAIGQLTGLVSIPGSEVVFGRAPGLQSHPNGQGGILAVSVPISLALIWSRNHRVIGVVGFFMGMAGLVACGSVTGMICASLGIMTVLIRNRVSIRNLFIIVVPVALGAIFVFNISTFIPGSASPLTRIADTTGNGEGESTLASRFQTDMFSIDQIVNNPFAGVGLDPDSGGTFDGTTATHNMFLLSWYQGGPLVFLAVVIFVFTCIWLLIRCNAAHSPELKTGIVAGVVASFSMSMTGPILYDRWFWIPFIFALSFSLSRESVRSDGRQGILTGVANVSSLQ